MEDARLEEERPVDIARERADRGHDARESAVSGSNPLDGYDEHVAGAHPLDVDRARLGIELDGRAFQLGHELRSRKSTGLVHVSGEGVLGLANEALAEAHGHAGLRPDG